MSAMNLERDEHNMGRLLNRLDRIIDLLERQIDHGWKEGCERLGEILRGETSDPGDMTAACEQLREIIEPNQEQAEAERKAAAEEVAPGIADTEMVMLPRTAIVDAAQALRLAKRWDLAECLEKSARPAKIDEAELRKRFVTKGWGQFTIKDVVLRLKEMGWL
jgi:hypothetical protein